MATFLRHKKLRINVPQLLRIIGLLVLIEGVFMAIPTIVAWSLQGPERLPFTVALALCLIFGGGAVTFCHPRERSLGKRDAALLTVLVWIIFSLFGMIPFLFHPLCLNVPTAFFEAMSGFTTTGASTLADVEALAPSMVIWRCMMQWIGGAGIILFTVALLPMLNSSGGLQMFNAELSGITHDKIRPRISSTAKRLWSIYTALTIVLCLLLWAGPMNFYESVCHAMSTASTGGFSTSNSALVTWHSTYVRIIVTLFMFVGGISFVTIYYASTGHLRKAWRDSSMRVYTSIIAFVSLLFIILAWTSGNGTDFEKLIVDPVFQVVSIVTSTGYTVDSAPSWGAIVMPILVILMVVGGCAGSTAGGMKVDRFVVLWKSLCNQTSKSIHPNRFYPLTVNGVTRSEELVVKIGAFVTSYILLVILGGLALTLMGIPWDDSFFASLSCMGNTGLGSGALGESYAAVPDAGKLLLSALMMTGRLEIFTLLILFTRTFWKR